MDDQSQNPGIHRQIYPAFITGLRKHVLNVAFYRVRGDMQILAYVLSEFLEVDFVLETVNILIVSHGASLDDETLIHSD